jgi:hypothetical protein
VTCNGFFPTGYKEFGSVLITDRTNACKILAKPAKKLKKKNVLVSLFFSVYKLTTTPWPDMKTDHE